MVNMTWEDAIEVADAHEALDAVEANVSSQQLTLRTAEGGLFTLGSRFWKAVGTKLVREYPNHDITVIVDAGEDAGIAMGAIADGHRAIRFTGEQETFEKLEQVGKEHGCMVVR